MRNDQIATWIGLSYQKYDYYWGWVDGNNSKYRNWEPDTPYEKDKNCVSVSLTLSRFDLNCIQILLIFVIQAVETKIISILFLVIK